MNLRARQINQENAMVRPAGAAGKMSLAKRQAPPAASRPALVDRNPNLKPQSKEDDSQIGGLKKKVGYGAHQQSRLTRNADGVTTEPLANIQRQASIATKPSAPIQPKNNVEPSRDKENEPMDTAPSVQSHLKAGEISNDISSDSVEMLCIASSEVPDIDEDDELSPEMASIYAVDIFDYLLHLEKKYTIPSDYMTNKTINGRMRGVLMDWMHQVHLRFHLLPETIYCTVQIFDRYIAATKVVLKSEIQLLGVTSMFIASKYEEMYAPEIADFVYITDDAYTSKQILAMEIRILNTLGCQLGRPLPIRFLRRYSKVIGSDTITHSLAKYFLELSLCEHQLAIARPSHIAAASLFLSFHILKTVPDLWNPSLVHYSRLKYGDFKVLLPKLVRFVTRVHTEKSKLQAVRNKFAQPKFGNVSGLVTMNLDCIQMFANDE